MSMDDVYRWVEEVEQVRVGRVESVRREPRKQRVCKIHEIDTPDIDLLKIFSVADEVHIIKNGSGGKRKFTVKIFVDGITSPVPETRKASLIERLFARLMGV